LRKLSIQFLVLHGLVEVKLQEDSDIRCVPEEPFSRSAPSQTFYRGVVDDEARIFQSTQPEISWGIAGVENPFHHELDLLPHLLCEVLILVVGLRLEVLNSKNVENINDMLTDLSLGTITDEHVHGAILANMVHEGGHKLFVRGAQAFGACESRLPPHKELGNNRAIVRGRNWAIDGVGGNWFIAPQDVKGWIGCLASMVQLGTLNGTKTTKLGSSLEPQKYRANLG
jgi:hypothetical protein